MGCSFYPDGVFLITRPCFFVVVFTNFFLTVDQERKTGITGVPFGRTDLSIGGIGTTFHALLHRTRSRGPQFSRDARKV